MPVAKLKLTAGEASDRISDEAELATMVIAQVWIDIEEFVRYMVRSGAKGPNCQIHKDYMARDWKQRHRYLYARSAAQFLISPTCELDRRFWGQMLGVIPEAIEKDAHRRYGQILQQLAGHDKGLECDPQEIQRILDLPKVVYRDNYIVSRKGGRRERKKRVFRAAKAVQQGAVGV